MSKTILVVEQNHELFAVCGDSSYKCSAANELGKFVDEIARCENIRVVSDGVHYMPDLENFVYTYKSLEAA